MLSGKYSCDKYAGKAGRLFQKTNQSLRPAKTLLSSYRELDIPGKSVENKNSKKGKGGAASSFLWPLCIAINMLTDTPWSCQTGVYFSINNCSS